MKPKAIKAGIFVRCEKNGFVREILYVSGTEEALAGRVVYTDRYGAGCCGVSSMARWATDEIPRPADWVRPHSEWVEDLGAEGKLPEQHGEAPRMVFSKKRSDLAKSIVLHAFRNTILETIHAGRGVTSRTGRYDDVKVVTPDGEIPWNDVSHISDEQMRTLMIKAVNTVYTMLSFPRLIFPIPKKWNDAEPDENMMAWLARSGCLGEAARVEADAKLAASWPAFFEDDKPDDL